MKRPDLGRETHAGAYAKGRRDERKRILEGIRSLPKPDHPACGTVGFRVGASVTAAQVISIILSGEDE